MSGSGPTVLAFGEKTPDIHPSVRIADGARILGDVVIGQGSSVWYNAVIRGDVHRVRIGERVNVQDNAVLHVTHDTAPLLIGDDVTIGHGAIVHGCTIGNGCLVGMGAIVLDGAHIGNSSLVAAGSMVRQHMKVPEGVLVAGHPAVVKRDLTRQEREDLAASAARYAGYAHIYIHTNQEP